MVRKIPLPKTPTQSIRIMREGKEDASDFFEEILFSLGSFGKKDDCVSFHYYMCHRPIAIDVYVLETFCFLSHGFLHSQLFFIAFKFTHPGQIDQLSFQRLQI